MRKIFFTPGPSQLFPTVEKHIQSALEDNIGAISHRGKEFQTIFADATFGLKKLLNIPKEYHIFFVSSGTEAMERVIENLVKKASFHFVNGSFSKRFFTIANELKKAPKKIEVEDGEGFDEKILKQLQDDKGGFQDDIKKAELICITQNETSTGVMFDPKNIYALKKRNPEKLIAVDIVSSVPYVNLDYQFLDCVFFSVQKGFGLPAGLGVIIISPKAMEKSIYLQKKGKNIGSYHNFPTLLQYADKNQTPETPSVLHIYLFSKVIQDMLKIGIKNIRKETEEKAVLLYNFFDNHQIFSPGVKEKGNRSQTVIVVNVGNRQKEVMDNLKQAGLIVGKGYGKNKDTQIRIANFPAHDKKDIIKVTRILQLI